MRIIFKILIKVKQNKKFSFWIFMDTFQVFRNYVWLKTTVLGSPSLKKCLNCSVKIYKIYIFKCDNHLKICLKQFATKSKTLTHILKSKLRSSWVVQSVKRLTLAGHDLMVGEFYPHIRLCAIRTRFGSSVPISLYSSPVHTLSLSLSQTIKKH